MLVGHRAHVADGRPEFLGEKIRFRGEQRGFYTETSTLDDSRLKRKEIRYALYRCPGGYMVLRVEAASQRRRERSRWHTKESSKSLLPVVDGADASHGEKTPVYGAYTEEEARQAFPELFSAVGLPNVRDLD